jgi:hypothetical protein
MADTQFPHLGLVQIISGPARLFGGRDPDPREIENKRNRQRHFEKISTACERISSMARTEHEQRARQGLPEIKGGVPFLLEVPDGDDNILDYLAEELGLELVSEGEKGFVLVNSEDIELSKLNELIAGFSNSVHGTAKGAKILEVYDSGSPERIRRILDEELLLRWPFREEEEFTLDISVQTAGLLAEIGKRPDKKLVRESEEEFAERQLNWDISLQRLYVKWDEIQMKREDELGDFLRPYSPEFEQIYHDPVALADSFTVRCKMRGKGFNDLVYNFPHLFELSSPDEINEGASPNTEGGAEPGFRLHSPPSDAPAVCVIDSGIQENHLLLCPAIDSDQSRCFIPGKDPKDVADYVSPGGHGTRVAGAVLYPTAIPTSGEMEAICWIQNARVLDEHNSLPKEISPFATLVEIVNFYRGGPHRTRIFNHSIAANRACRTSRMMVWATVIDHLSHTKDVLLIQAAGNINDRNVPWNPGVADFIDEGATHPEYLLRPSARIANPAQSLQALTVGSIARSDYVNGNYQSISGNNRPSSFTRSGFGLWGTVKPEVVEFGGDSVRDDGNPVSLTTPPDVCPELVRSTMYPPGPLFARDAIGTSFAAPKVANIAAQLNRSFPDQPTLLYRALIAQSARWPTWAEHADPESCLGILKTIGYGVPDLDRATSNTPYRVTLITDGIQSLRAGEAAIYSIDIPQVLRNPALESDIRIDVTLSYSAEPRRTRSSRRGYLAVWLDWIMARPGERLSQFKQLAIKKDFGTQKYEGDGYTWMLAQNEGHGYIRGDGCSRNNGTLQKDWTFIKSHDLPESIAIAVRGHRGWAGVDPNASAKFALVVSFEAVNRDLEVYQPVQNMVEGQVQAPEIRL